MLVRVLMVCFAIPDLRTGHWVVRAKGNGWSLSNLGHVVAQKGGEDRAGIASCGFL